MSTVNKITTGYVIQEFDSDTGKCLNQTFIAGDSVDWEDDCGHPIDEPAKSSYFPLDMIQPENHEPDDIEYD